MTKNDLKDWMIVELRNGTKYLYCSQNNGFLTNTTVKIVLSLFNDDLIHDFGNKSCDIVKIYKSKNSFFLDYDIFKDENLELIWERDGTNWSEIKIDTPILVSDSYENFKKGIYKRRHFAKYEDNKIYAFSNGTTSWSTIDKYDICSWDYAKLLYKDIEYYKNEEEVSF